MSKFFSLQIWSYFTFTSFLITDLSFLAKSGGGIFHFYMSKDNTNTSTFLYFTKNTHFNTFILLMIRCSVENTVSNIGTI
jgi:hypothetical protein